MKCEFRPCRIEAIEPFVGSCQVHFPTAQLYIGDPKSKYSGSVHGQSSCDLAFFFVEPAKLELCASPVAPAEIRETGVQDLEFIGFEGLRFKGLRGSGLRGYTVEGSYGCGCLVRFVSSGDWR